MWGLKKKKFVKNDTKVNQDLTPSFKSLMLTWLHMRPYMWYNDGVNIIKVIYNN